MKTDHPNLQRIKIDKDHSFSHGPNLIGVHVDCIVTLDAEERPRRFKPATHEQILRYCK